MSDARKSNVLESNSPALTAMRSIVRESTPALRGVVILALLLGGTSQVSAQEDSTSIQMQRLAPEPGADDIVGIQSSTTPDHLSWQLGVYLNFADDVLELRDANDNTAVRLIDSQTGLDLMGSLGLWNRIDLGVVLPITIQRNEQALANMDLGLSSAGIGDVRLVPKVRLVSLASILHLAVAAPVSLPTGSGEFLTDDRLTAEPRLIAELRGDSGARIAVNVGIRLRPERTFANLTVSNEFTFGLGAHVPLGRSSGLAFISTLTGALGLDESNGEEQPIEWLAGVEYGGFKDMVVGLSAGPGLSKGYGTPDFRVVAGVTYRRTPPPPPLCKYGEEDLDGFVDYDNCRDPDNDQDGILDEDDVCPNEAETHNEIEDEDGCPDEMLARRAEDPAAEPELELKKPSDGDGDGILDGDDSCPAEAEDMDSFEDLDGCPESDNDKDSIADAIDGCPLQAEIINGVEDEDGCPDEGTSSVTVTDKAILILDKVYFETAKAAIKSQSFNLLDQVAATLKANRQLTRVRIEGHTDDRGQAKYNLQLSQSRANAVREYLVAKGVEANRLESQGYGKSKPIDTNRTIMGRANNRRVEFRILELNGEPVPDESQKDESQTPEDQSPTSPTPPPAQ